MKMLLIFTLGLMSLAVVATSTIPTVREIDLERNQRARADVVELTNAAEAFRRDLGRLPRPVHLRTDLCTGAGLPSARTLPGGRWTGWRGPYTTQLCNPARDPWGRLFFLREEAGRVVVLSAGADGRFGTGDDVR